MPELNWFDVIVLLSLAFGAARGWINGPGWELPRFFRWLLIVVFAWSLAHPAANLGRWLGIDPVATRFTVFALVTTLILWTFLALLKGAIERLGPMVGGGNALRSLGVLLGVLRYSLQILLLLALLAILPGSPTRLGEIRRQILTESTSGILTRSYWFPLTPELDSAHHNRTTT